MLGGLWLLFFAKVVIFVIIDSHAHYNNNAYSILFSAVTIIHDSLILPQKGTSANPFRSWPMCFFSAFCNAPGVLLIADPVSILKNGRNRNNAIL